MPSEQPLVVYESHEPPLFREHHLCLTAALFVFMTEKMEKAVYQQPCQLICESIPLLLCLLGGPVERDSDIAYKCVVICWKGEYVGRSIPVKIESVELPYLGVIGHEKADLAISMPQVF